MRSERLTARPPRLAFETSLISSRVPREGRKLLPTGNGGRVGEAQHIAGELLSRLNYDLPPVPDLA